MKPTARLLVCVFLILVWPAALAVADSLTVKLTFDGAGLSLQSRTGGDGESYTAITPAGCHETTTQEGKPELPAKTVRILLPPGANLDSVNASPKAQQAFSAAQPAYPKQPPQPTSIDHPAIPWVPPDPSTYAASSPYPGERIYWRRGHDHIGNFSVAEVVVYPVDYTGVSQSVTLYTEIEITLSYTPGAEERLPVLRRSALASDTMRAYIAGLVVNPEMLESYIDPPRGAQTVDMVIISKCAPPDAVADEWNRLADWKTKRGVVTKLISTDWIVGNFSGVDLAERIRNFIKYAYTNWGTVYVLLGGDTDTIPDRKAHAAMGDWGPTDLYYAGLDGTWNANGNAQFGEYDDQCDETADVFVGRAPVRASSEVKRFVDKVLNYERLVPDTIPVWPRYPTSILLMGATIYNWPWGQELSNRIVSDYIPPDWDIWRLYAPTEPGGDEWLSRTTAVNRMCQGFHLINHADHSGPYAMGTGLDHNDWWERLMTRRDIDSLTNSKRQSILFSLGCSPNAFDMDSISEHFINNPTGGGLGYIGNTRVGFASQQYQSFKFYESLFLDNLYHLGAAFASILYGGSFECRSMNLLGDPEVPVWTAAPRQMIIAVPENITTRPTDVTAYVMETSGMPPWPPVEGALVTFSKGDEIYVSAVTNQYGQATVHLSPETAGNIDIAASKQNYVTATEVLPVIATSEPVLSHAGHRIDDDQQGESIGNGNGLADAGETIEIPVELKNGGGSIAVSVHATLTCGSPFVTIIDPEEDWPDIPSEGRAWCVDDFDVAIAPETPDGTVVKFGLDIFGQSSSGELLHWTDEFEITVHAPNIRHVGHRVDDKPAGNGNGILERGETAQVPILLRNSGSGLAFFVMAQLESLSPNLIVVQSTIHFHQIEPRTEEWNCPFAFLEVRATGDYVPGDQVRLTMWDDLGHTWTEDFDFKPIGAPDGLTLTPGRMCMDLKWNKHPDALGYHVYRRLPGETDFTRLDDELVTTATLFHDSGLPAGKPCEYRVTAVNSTYNDSTTWAEGSEWTNPALVGGWPKEIGSNGIEGSSAAVGYVYGAGQQIVICGTDNKVYVWNADGTPVPGWPKSVPMPNSGVPTANGASPALANLDDDAMLEIVVAAGRYVYVWNGDGTSLPGWPQEMAGTTNGSASIGDIDRDGAPEIVASSASPPYVYAWNADGSLVPGWPVTINHPEDLVRTTAALGDIDADGYPEVIVGTLDTAYQQSEVYVWKGNGQLAPYWPQPVDFVIWSAPVVGDIDGDYRNEIIVGNMRDRIYAWHGDGSVQEGNWPVYVGSSVANACALADLDSDGLPEVLAGLGNGTTTALRHDGTPLAGWPVYAEPGAMNSPSIADLNGDGSQDVVAPSGDSDGRLHVFRADGTNMFGSPYATGGGIVAAPTIVDLDATGQQTPSAEIIAGGLDRLVYNWTLPWNYDPTTAEWPTFMHDFRRTGAYGPDNTGQPVLINRIAAVKYYPDGAWIRVPGKIVTATPSDFARAIYVQEIDRSCGIRVEPNTSGIIPIERWQSVDVVGRLATIEGERVLVDATVEPGILNVILRPVAMSNRRLGGGPVGHFTWGVYPDGTGPNNIGLLVTSYGRVTWVSPDGDRFYIDDGSKLQDGSGHVGVWVSLAGLAPGNHIAPPPEGSYAVVTGISSCGYGPLEPAVRILRPRFQADIAVYAEE